MSCKVLTSDHIVFARNFCWVFTTQSLLCKRFVWCDIKVLSQTLVPPTPEWCTPWFGRSFGTSIHIRKILKPFSSFLPGNQLLWATFGLTQVNSFFPLYTHLRTSFLLQSCLKISKCIFNSPDISKSQVFTSHWPRPIAHELCQQHNYEYIMLYPQSTTMQ